MTGRLTGPFRVPEEKVPMFVRRLTGPLVLLSAAVLVVRSALGERIARFFGVKA